MSASREKKTRADASGVQRRSQEENKDRRKHILYGAAGAVIAVLAIALLVWDSGFFQKRSTAVTIDGEDFGPAVVQFYYQNALNNAYYESFTSGTSFDASADPAGQIYDEETGETWRDHLLDQAIDSLTQVTALCHAAEAEGYGLTPVDQAYLDGVLETLDQTWRSGGMYTSLDSYLQVNYGSYMDGDTLRALYEDQVLADSYQQHYLDSLTYTDEEVEAYYSEHTNDLDTFGYSLFAVQAAPEQETDEDGNPVEQTDEEAQAALEAAKTEALAQAQEIQGRLDAGENAQNLTQEYTDLYASSAHAVVMGSNFASAPYADWLYDAARQAGETTIAEYDGGSTYTYYVLQFDSRQRDETPTADVRHILIGAGSSPTEEEYAEAEEQAQALLDQWQSGEATEESFAVLAVENTADGGSQRSGGLYTGISYLDGWDPNFLNWAMNGSRQPGDTGLVKNESSSTKGWHIMYFVGWDDPAWMYTVKSSFKSDGGAQWLDSLTEGLEIVRGSGLNHIA